VDCGSLVEELTMLSSMESMLVCLNDLPVSNKRKEWLIRTSGKKEIQQK